MSMASGSSRPKRQPSPQSDEVPLEVSNICNILQCTSSMHAALNEAIHIIERNEPEYCNIALNCHYDINCCNTKNALKLLCWRDRFMEKLVCNPDCSNEHNAKVVYDSCKLNSNNVNKYMIDFLNSYMGCAVHFVMKSMDKEQGIKDKKQSIKVQIPELDSVYQGAVYHAVSCQKQLVKHMERFLPYLSMTKRFLVQDFEYVIFGSLKLHHSQLLLLKETAHLYLKFRIERSIANSDIEKDISKMTKIVSYIAHKDPLIMNHSQDYPEDIAKFVKADAEFYKQVSRYFTISPEIETLHKKLKICVEEAVGKMLPPAPVDVHQGESGCFVYDFLAKMAVNRSIAEHNDLQLACIQYFTPVSVKNLRKIADKAKQIKDEYFDECMKTLVDVEMNYHSEKVQSKQLVVHQFQNVEIQPKDKKPAHKVNLLKHIAISDDTEYKAVILMCYSPEKRRVVGSHEKTFFAPKLVHGGALFDNPFLHRTICFKRVIIPVCLNYHYFCLLIEAADQDGGQVDPGEIEWKNMCCYRIDSLNQDKQKEEDFDRMKVEVMNILSFYEPLSKIPESQVFVKMKDFEKKYTDGIRMKEQQGLTCGYHCMLNCLCLAKTGRTFVLDDMLIQHLWKTLVTSGKIKSMYDVLDRFIALLKPNVREGLCADTDKTEDTARYSSASELMTTFSKAFKDVTETYKDKTLPDSPLDQEVSFGMHTRADFYLEIWDQYITTQTQYKSKMYSYTSKHWDMHDAFMPAILCTGSAKNFLEVCINNMENCNALCTMHQVVLDYLRFNEVNCSVNYEKSINGIFYRIKKEHHDAKKKRVAFIDE